MAVTTLNRLAQYAAAAPPAPLRHPTALTVDCPYPSAEAAVEQSEPAIAPAPAAGPAPATTNTSPPRGQRARDSLLYAARLIVGAGERYDGDIAVTVSAPSVRSELTVSAPAGGVTPEASALAVAPTAAGFPPGLPPDGLLRAFLSPEEVRILRIVAAVAAGRSITATTVQAQLVEHDMVKNRFWTLWSNLQQRGLVVELGSVKRGYVLGCEWVRVLLS